MEQQVWSLLHARQSTLRPRVAVPSSHSALQGHAAHTVEWSAMLRPNGSWGTCIPQGMLHSLNALHGAPFEFPIRWRRAQAIEMALSFL